MTIEGMPSGLVPTGQSLEFTRDTLPEALQNEHALADGRWGVLHVLEGSLIFVDLESGEEESVQAPGRVVILPRRRHKVKVTGPVRCRVHFLRQEDVC